MKTKRPRYFRDERNHRAEKGVDLIMTIAKRDLPRAKSIAEHVGPSGICLGLYAIIAWTQSNNANQRKMAFALLARIGQNELFLHDNSAFITPEDYTAVISNHFE